MSRQTGSGVGHCRRSGVTARALLQPDTAVSRRALLRALGSSSAALALGGCASQAFPGARHDASAVSDTPTLLVATTRKPVNGGRAKPWFGPERASPMSVARAKLTPPDDGRFSLASVGLGDWQLDGIEPVPGSVGDLLAAGDQRRTRRPDLRARLQPDIRSCGARRRPRSPTASVSAARRWCSPGRPRPDCSTIPTTAKAPCGRATASNACSIPCWRARTSAASTSSPTAWAPC